MASSFLFSSSKQALGSGASRRWGARWIAWRSQRNTLDGRTVPVRLEGIPGSRASARSATLDELSSRHERNADSFLIYYSYGGGGQPANGQEGISATPAN